jgi:hypothetical protein
LRNRIKRWGSKIRELTELAVFPEIPSAFCLLLLCFDPNESKDKSKRTAADQELHLRMISATNE